jgi:hypothetical protein
MASLIGDGPRQYLLDCENQAVFDAVKLDHDEDLRPTDAVERMWVDEIADLDWHLHRLRSTRHGLVEGGLITGLVDLARQTPAGRIYFENPKGPERLQAAARAYAKGLPAARDFFVDLIGAEQVEAVLHRQMAQTFEARARLEQSIETTLRCREAVLNCLYGRRAHVRGVTADTGEVP